ncbi:ATP-binding protein [Sphingobacterium sp. MYb382]|uniref:ATP-binding protein n=1 Tax=Sphingobacterium sp. MYb382 TaxID=2745278 RepID=UPI00309794E7
MPNRNLPLFEVIPENKRYFERSSKKSVFVIEKNNWNDYWFFTAYTLYHSAISSSSDKDQLIGHLKILKRGQSKNQFDLLKEGVMEYLDEDFCSMGADLDYYQRLSDLEPTIRKKVLNALNDVVNNVEIRNTFEAEDGFKVSLLRGRNLDDDIFDLGKIIIERNYKALFDMHLKLSFDMPGLTHSIEFDFSNPTVGYQSILPERIGVLIGRNGSGKSTILSRLSRIASSMPQDRIDQTLQDTIGTISPEGVGFPRVIFLSYSPFDSFNTPGLTLDHKKRIINEMKHGLGSYMFCGTRNIVKELESSFEQIASRAHSSGRLADEDIISDRIEKTILKSNQELAQEFSRNIQMISQTRNAELIQPVIEILRQEQTLNHLLAEKYSNNTATELEHFFNQLSTGHKFVIHAMSSIISTIAPRSLLLFDEPETHLHPPMLAVLMKAIRYTLDRTNSTMIVATHSPVVLQETISRQVLVVRREGKSIKASPPKLETFGENVGILTQTAFGLSTDISQYHDVLDEMIGQYFFIPPGKTSLSEVLAFVEKHFDKGLSMQARSYVMSQIANKLND